MSSLQSEWGRPGATISDKNARKEFGMTQEEILQAMRVGRLQYREMSMHGNPWFRLLRREVEKLVTGKKGSGYLKDRNMKTKIDSITREITKLKKQIAALEKRKEQLLVTKS